MNLLALNWLDRENPSSGGAEVHLHETFGGLAARGWQVTLITSRWPGAPHRTTIDDIDVHRVGGRYTYPLLAPGYARRLARGARFDAVVEDLNKAPLFSPLWSSLPCILLVHHLFGSTGFRGAPLPVAAATWLLERPLPYCYRRIPVVAVSESTRMDLVRRGFSRGRVQVIENGVDAEYYVPDPARRRFDRPTLLYLGRLKRYKRVDLILDALRRVRQEGVDARLLVAGRGDWRPALEKQARALGLQSDAVEFLGFVDEAQKLILLQRCWVHVLTSVKEGWGITNLEAAACGTPTVASDSPGLRDSVIDRRTGFLVAHGDTEALAGKLALLLSDSRLRREMGTAAREFALTLSWNRASRRFARVVAHAVASRNTEG